MTIHTVAIEIIKCLSNSSINFLDLTHHEETPLFQTAPRNFVLAGQNDKLIKFQLDCELQNKKQ